MDKIFTDGWILNVILYGSIFLLGEYAVYRIIFQASIGRPRSYRDQDIKYWLRKANFLSAVIFAPLFEEVMFTYLAYNSFLNHAQAGQEGLVVLFVAIFFALLHLPGDIRGQVDSDEEIDLYLLFKWQVHRFFYSLAAFFIYQQTQSLWITIFLHYFYNAIVSVFNFDLEDQQFHITNRDGYVLMIILMNTGFAFIGSFFFYFYAPQLGIFLFLLVAFVLFDYFTRYGRFWFS